MLRYLTSTFVSWTMLGGSSSDVPICGPKDMIGCVIRKADEILSKIIIYL